MLDTAPTAHSAPNKLDAFYLEIPLADVDPSPLNPRQAFDEEGLAELAASIREHGLLQPIVVRPRADGERYEIVAGERRYRACQKLGLETITCALVDVADEKTHLQLALVENLQRRDLDPLEEARGYEQLHRLCGLKQAEIAAAVNRSQPAVANRIRLLDLPETVQATISEGKLSPAHGIALARYAKFPKAVAYLAEKAVERGYTSKQLERGLIDGWEMESKGLVKQLGQYGTAFDHAKVCNACPHDARRDGYCYQPSCWQRHQADGQKAKREALAEAVTKATKVGSGVLDLSKVPYEAYEYMQPWSAVPAGCTRDAGCPKYVDAIGRDGGEMLKVCSDPACLKRLREAAGRAEAQVKREAKKRRLTQLTAAVDALADVGPRELAVLVAQVLGAVYAAPKRAAVARLLPEWAQEKGEISAGRERLVALEPLAQLKLALETLLREQIDRDYEYYGGPKKDGPVAWYLGPETAPENAGGLPVL